MLLQMICARLQRNQLQQRRQADGVVGRVVVKWMEVKQVPQSCTIMD